MKSTSNIAEWAAHPPGPRFGERDRGQRCQNVNPSGRHPDLIHHALTTEILDGNVRKRRAKCGERVHNAHGIVWRRVNPHIQVARGAWTTVQRECICPDDEEPNVSGDERAQQIDKVLVHRAARRAGARDS
jgi:hypothetical protein